MVLSADELYALTMKYYKNLSQKDLKEYKDKLSDPARNTPRYGLNTGGVYSNGTSRGSYTCMGNPIGDQCYRG